MKWIVAIYILCLAISQPCLAQGNGSAVKPSGKTTLSAVVGKARVEVSLWTSVVKFTTDEEMNRWYAQCSHGRTPCSITGRIRIYVNGAEVFVPRAACADLGDIVSAKFSRQGAMFALTIDGGDASASYRAVLTFNRERVVGRKLYNGEFPSRPLEVSRFYTW
jgi:hypothetical protein